MSEKIKVFDDSGDRKYFTIIPNYILNHSTHYDREVYIQMKRITGENGKCWISQKNLAKQCGFSVWRLKKSLDYLVEHNWIKAVGKKEVITKGGIQSVNQYKIVDLWQKNNDFYKDKGVSSDNYPLSKGVSSDQQGGYRQTSKGVSSDTDKEDININKNHIKEDISKPVACNPTNQVIDLFKEVNPSYEKFFSNITQRKALERLIIKFGQEKVSNMIKALPDIIYKPYAPKITTPLQLEDNLGKLIAFIKTENNQQPKFIEI